MGALHLSNPNSESKPPPAPAKPDFPDSGDKDRIGFDPLLVGAVVAFCLIVWTAVAFAIFRAADQ